MQSRKPYSGSILKFSRDDSITCKVISDRTIEINGTEISLSAAASELLKKRGWRATQVQGPMFWLYEGEPLEERRLKIEMS